MQLVKAGKSDENLVELNLLLMLDDLRKGSFWDLIRQYESPLQLQSQ